MLNRLEDWKSFSDRVEEHITEYTIPQYQSDDNGEDQVNIWTSDECITAIKKYVSRFGKTIRGEKEALRDMLKIAHYAQFAHDKLKIEFSKWRKG